MLSSLLRQSGRSLTWLPCGLQVATKEKNAAEDRMAKVQARLDEMQAQFDAAMAQKQLLEDDAAACQKKMDSAAALLHALAGRSGLKACYCWPVR